MPAISTRCFIVSYSTSRPTRTETLVCWFSIHIAQLWSYYSPTVEQAVRLYDLGLHPFQVIGNDHYVRNDNNNVVARFLDYLKIEKGLAPLTVSAYATD